MIVSPELAAWCEKAHWHVREVDGVTELRSLEGRTQLNVTPQNQLSGMHEVFEMNHAGDGHWVLEAAPEDVERYLAVRLATSVRAGFGFQPLEIPGAEGQEALGFELDFEDVVVVVKEGATDRAFFPKRGAVPAPQPWVQFTHYASLYLPELYAMLAEADGDGPFAPA